jgi:hypothetical protein
MLPEKCLNYEENLVIYSKKSRYEGNRYIGTAAAALQPDL